MISDFDIGNAKNKFGRTKSHLYSFGASHKVYKKVYNPDCPQKVDNNAQPGPGQYSFKIKSIGTEGRNQTIQGRSTNVQGKSTPPDPQIQFSSRFARTSPDPVTTAAASRSTPPAATCCRQ
jgi:hypothetical protein